MRLRNSIDVDKFSTICHLVVILINNKREKSIKQQKIKTQTLAKRIGNVVILWII